MKNCILLHLYHQDLWHEYWNLLKEIKDDNTDIFVTVTDINTSYYNEIKNNTNDVFLVENKGLDFGGFLYAYNKIKHINYNTITKLHSKKQSGFAWKGLRDAEQWRSALCKCMIGSKDIYRKRLKMFEDDESLFMFGSKKCFHVEPIYMANKENVVYFETLKKFLEINENCVCYQFIAGAMFMVSKKYMDSLFKDKESIIYDKLEYGYKADGTLAHAIERLIGSAVSFYGGDFLCL
jgi:lipopolysaccharide biosynthesis protein